MDLGLRGKKAVISGASKGIGRACAEALAEEGCDVTLVSRTAGDLEAAQKAIPGGNLDMITEDRWRAAWDLKVFGYINMTRRFYDMMRKRGHGVIVNVLGAAGENPDFDYIAGSS